MTLRPATASDADALVPLFRQLGYPTELAEVRRRLERRGDATKVIVAIGDGAVIGFIVVALVDHVIVGSIAEIEGLVVDEGSRGRRVGEALVEAAERWASERGISSVHVRSNVVRERAHAFYLRNGYARIKSQHVFEKHLRRSR